MNNLEKIIKLPFQIISVTISIVGGFGIACVAAPFILLFWLMDINN
jgi:hypothetical protein